MRRLLAATVVGFVLALSGVVATSLPAQACSCVASTLSQRTTKASDVLVGTVQGRLTSTTATGGSAAYDVAVERVYKGQAGATLTVRTPAAGSCGLALAADRRYLLFGTREGQVVEVNLCGGTRAASTRAVQRVVRLLGDGSAPEATTTPAAPAYQTLEERADPGFARLAAPGAAIALVGFLGLMLVRRVGRPH